MNGGAYDPKWVESFYDAYGMEEWDRLVKDPGREVQLAVYNNILSKFISPGDKVLEIGAGPGRFTQYLVELGAQVTVADISNVQLDLNKNHAEEFGFAHGIAEWRQVDMCDMSCYQSDSFDHVVCLGGPLSYVFEKRSIAVQECQRVTKQGGVVIFGVMSLWGTIHQYLHGILGFTAENNAAIIATGDLTKESDPTSTHFCHLFRSPELRELLESHGLTVELMSASSGISAVHGELLNSFRADATQWKQLIELEILACQQPGYLDAGTHLVAVGRK